MLPASDRRIMTGSERAALSARLDRMGRLLDSAVRIPGTRIDFGADAVANLLPGIGPLASKAVSAWIIWQAHRLGAPPALLVRMAGNVALDAAIGAVPVAGWLADVVLRANRRNLDLLAAHLAGAPARPPDPSRAAGAPAAA